MESDLGCTLMIYFDTISLTLHNVTLMSQKPCYKITSVAAKQTVLNVVYVFFNKISQKQYFIEKFINFIYSAD